MLTTLHNLGGIWGQSWNLSILYCGKLKSKSRQRSEDWSGTIWTQSKSKCCHTGKHSHGGAWLNPAEHSLPHFCAATGDASREAWPPNLCWSHSPNKLSIAMPANCALMQRLDSMIHVDSSPTQNIVFLHTPPKTSSVSELLLSPTKPFLFLFFLLFALVFSLFSMPCLCMYVQGLYSFYWRFLVNMGLGCNPPITHSKGAWLTSLSKSTEKSAAHYSYFLLQRSAWTPSCAVPKLRPAYSPWTFRRALRLPSIDFYVPWAVWSRGLSKHCTLQWVCRGLPWSSPARSVVGLAVPGAEQPCCWHACNHTKENTAASSVSRAGEHPQSQQRQQLTSVQAATRAAQP